jgi:regulator of cell morphogenesis and NO signaling
MTDTHSPSLADIVAGNPAAGRVLDGFGLDFCCHGERSLESACAAAGIDPGAVEASLREVHSTEDATWTTLDPAALAAHIVTTHHAYLHEELPLLDALAAKVLEVHGTRHPERGEVRRLVRELRADLEPHLLKEEQILFPAITELANGRRPLPFVWVADPIRVMSADHDRDGELLRRLRRATADYVVPDDGCASYRSLYERLDALEADTHQHILKENHTLFPAALALAARR